MSFQGPQAFRDGWSVTYPGMKMTLGKWTWFTLQMCVLYSQIMKWKLHRTLIVFDMQFLVIVAEIKKVTQGICPQLHYKYGYIWYLGRKYDIIKSETEPCRHNLNDTASTLLKKNTALADVYNSNWLVSGVRNQQSWQLNWYENLKKFILSEMQSDISYTLHLIYSINNFCRLDA